MKRLKTFATNLLVIWHTKIPGVYKLPLYWLIAGLLTAASVKISLIQSSDAFGALLLTYLYNQLLMIASAVSQKAMGYQPIPLPTK